MNTVGIYIRWNGDKSVFAAQEKSMIKYAREQGYDSYVQYHDPELVIDSDNLLATAVAQQMLRDAKAGLIKAAIARIIYPIGVDLYRANNFSMDFAELSPELAFVFVAVDPITNTQNDKRVKAVK